MDLRSYCSRCSDGAIALKNDPQGLCAVCRSKCHPDHAAQLKERDAIIDEALDIIARSRFAFPLYTHEAAGYPDRVAALRARIEEARR